MSYRPCISCDERATRVPVAMTAVSGKTGRYADAEGQRTRRRYQTGDIDVGVGAFLYCP